MTKTTKKDKAFYDLHPDLGYTEFANSRELDRNAINIGYKSTLKSLKKSGSRACRKQAKYQENVFATRNNISSEFGKRYKDYWDLKDSRANESMANRTAQQLQQITSENTINLAQIAWKSIRTQTRAALELEVNSLEVSTTTSPLTNTSSPEAFESTTATPSTNTSSSEISNNTIAPSSTYVGSHTDNDSTDEVFKEFFHDINEAIEYSLGDIIDWTVEAVREMVKDKFPPDIFTALEDLCQFKGYEYTIECKRLINRLIGEEKAVMGWRQELLNYHGFNNKQFDPSKNRDWAYVKFITEHFLRLMEYATNPLTLPLAERTAVSYTMQPIFNHLLLPHLHLVNIKWQAHIYYYSDILFSLNIS